VECTCPEAIVETRLRSRESQGGDISDGRWELFRAQKGSFERIDEIPAGSHLVVDTSREGDENVLAAVKRLSEPG